jgi:glycogen debranching enzyme
MGLVNQCWKDSWNSIVFSDGTLAKLPRATCEIQGYVYDARVRCARLAREFWNDPVLAGKLEEQASALKRRFNQDFWVADRGYYALALDGDKRQVDALSSNIGHLLWSGIADKDKAVAVVEHLLGPRLFSGWGVRTLAEGQGGYSPIGYHVGAVWPHDNSLIACGLRRYGFAREAAQLAYAMLQASQYFDGRLPEAFAGYPRDFTRFPVEYPTACSPQAWASGTPLLMLRALLGLEPIGDQLLVAPAVPKEIERLGLVGIPGRWGSADAFAFGRIALGAPAVAG